VNYFKYIGGFNLKEAVNLCLKEGSQDSVTPLFTWWGREDQRPLYNTRFIIAIYGTISILQYILILLRTLLMMIYNYCVFFSEAASSNRYIKKPTRSEFQRQMREALRATKERCRSKTCMRRTRRDQRRDFWNDDVVEENEEESVNE
jgi:hypothetical protein